MAIDTARVKFLFQAAIELTDPGERGAFLDREAGGDAELRGRLDALLAVYEQPPGALDRPLGDNLPLMTAAWPVEPRELLPSSSELNSAETAAEEPSQNHRGNGAPALLNSVIAGRYKLRQAIGEGGMGTVYFAEQIQPVRRQVALKLIRAGMDSRTVLARFESERQALALMDHPNIARVLDAGTTDSGHPFFVMELVKGIPLTDFCDQHRLDMPTRLNLFRQICSAVQHAHQKGIIHRDLKPTNILVEDHAGTPVPKVIDFGLAKATSGLSLTEASLFTAFGTIAGTPLYMAPEQATFNSLDVDTRADIYALGVILYELLTGTTLIRKESLQRAALDEVMRVIREEEAQVPSHRISTSEALPSVAATRQVEPIRLGRFVRGDLDWIVMKALAKDRSRRYDSAVGLANDIERFLKDEPVTAGPPTARYRTAKFIRRHRGRVVAASLIVLALIGGVVGTTVGLFEARRQEQVARHQEQEARRQEQKARQQEALATERAEGERRAKLDAQEKKALAEANEKRAIAAVEGEKTAKETAEAVLGFVETKVFDATRPQGQDGGLNYDVTLVDAITSSLPAIEPSFTGKPLVQARLRRTIGRSYQYLGKYDLAVGQFAAARSLSAQHLGPDHPDTLEILDDLAMTYYQLGRYAEALKLREERLALQKAKLGPDHPDTVKSMQLIASLYYLILGRPAEAVRLYEEAFALQKARLGPDHPDMINNVNILASIYIKFGRRDEAVKIIEETLALQKAKLGPNYPGALSDMAGLADIYTMLGRHAEAAKLREEGLALQKAKLGPDHPDTLMALISLGLNYRAAGRYVEAAKANEEYVAFEKAKLGPDHPWTLLDMAFLADSYRDLGRHAEALKLLEETLARCRVKFSPDGTVTRVIMDKLATTYRTAGQYANSLKLREEMLALRRAKLGPGHSDTLTSMADLAFIYSDLKRHDEALKLREEVLALRRAKLGPDHLDTFRSMGHLADSYDDLGRHAEALKLREEALAQRRIKLGADHSDTLGNMNTVASAYTRFGRHDDAIKLREEAIALHRAKLGPDHPDTLYAMSRLADALLAAGRTIEALSLLDKTAAAKPEDLSRATRIAALWAWFGREAEYATARRRGLTVAQGTSDLVQAERAAKLSSILPSADRAELDAALALARLAAKPGDEAPYRSYRLLALGMAAYRSGQDQESDEALRSALEISKNIPRVAGAAAFYRAMGLHRRGQTEEGRRIMTEAAATMKPLPGDEKNPLAGNANHDDLILWLAYKEAKALIESQPQPTVPVGTTPQPEAVKSPATAPVESRPAPTPTPAGGKP